MISISTYEMDGKVVYHREVHNSPKILKPRNEISEEVTLVNPYLGIWQLTVEGQLYSSEKGRINSNFPVSFSVFQDDIKILNISSETFYFVDGVSEILLLKPEPVSLTDVVDQTRFTITMQPMTSTKRKVTLHLFTFKLKLLSTLEGKIAVHREDVQSNGWL